MSDTSFDDFDSGPPPEESNNRTFVIIAGILGGVILISAACLAAIVLFNGQGNNQQPNGVSLTQTQDAANAFINQALTSTFEASILPTTTSTPLPTSTSVVSLATATLTPDPSLATVNPITATVAAALTQAAAAQLTIVPTSTALPNTGFADEYGLPGMFVMTLAFVIVILLSRRLRAAPVTNK
jgi:hypothetical protein